MEECACGVRAGQNEVMRDWRYHRQKIMIQQERSKFMGGILGACNAISDYLHTLNMGSTLFRLILAMFLGCLIGIDRWNEEACGRCKNTYDRLYGGNSGYDDGRFYPCIF